MLRISTAISSKTKALSAFAIIAGVLAAAGGFARAAPDKYSLKVPGGLAFADFKGYED